MSDLKKVIEWANETLKNKGFVLSGKIEDIQTTAWSNIHRIHTETGYVYLKITAELLSMEPIIAEMLSEKFHASVPIVIDKNIELNCFLMKDAGTPFWGYKNKELKTTFLTEAIRQYKYIQKQCETYLSDLFALGVPDWQLEKLSEHFQQLIKQEDLLINDGMLPDEINKLSKCQSACEKLCNDLAKFNMPATLDHCDLHGGNILIDEKTHHTTIIDWGEVVITHPFLSRVGILRGVVQYYDFQEQELWDLLFKIESIEKEELIKMVNLTKRLEPVYSALTFQRLFLASDKTKFMAAPKCRGRITKYLQEFIHGIKEGS